MTRAGVRLEQALTSLTQLDAEVAAVAKTVEWIRVHTETPPSLS